MNLVKPKVFLIGETQINQPELKAYLDHIGAPDWSTDAPTSSELIAEIMGRGCYRSFGPGMNPNVTKVREGNDRYLGNIKRNLHGSVFEHSMLNFMICDVSRVFTHELIRHRTGTAVSQESLRYVRLDKINAYYPIAFEENETMMTVFVQHMKELEKLQREMSELFGLDDEKKFSRKKKLTSAMRRLAPIGLATNIGWSTNFRNLHNVIQQRTDPAAEEEIRYVFKIIAEIVTARYPNAFGDFEKIADEDGSGLCWYRSVNGRI